MHWPRQGQEGLLPMGSQEVVSGELKASGSSAQPWWEQNRAWLGCLQKSSCHAAVSPSPFRPGHQPPEHLPGVPGPQ